MADTPAPKESQDVRGYKSKIVALEDKLKRLKSGELKAGQPEDPAQPELQQEAIERTEAFLRAAKGELHKLTKKGGA